MNESTGMIKNWNADIKSTNHKWETVNVKCKCSVYVHYVSAAVNVPITGSNHVKEHVMSGDTDKKRIIGSAPTDLWLLLPVTVIREKKRAVAILRWFERILSNFLKSIPHQL
jgi:hypothetical protein